MKQGSEMNIYQRINKIMKLGLYVKKGSAGQGTGVQYDDLIAMLNPHLAEAGIVVVPEKTGEATSRQNAKGGYIYQSDFAIHYINADNPQDRFVSTIEAHAMDSGDKAPGKAITYATKTSMLKVFGIESGDNEESRADQMDIDTINQEQQAQLFSLLCDASGMYTEKGQRIAKAYKFTNLSEIKTKKFNEILGVASK